MGIRFILRTRSSQNKFRDWFLRGINLPTASSILICSGFFQENYLRSAYALSADPDFVTGLTGKFIITLGVHSPTWIPTYKSLQANLLARGINIFSLSAKQSKWHAKLLIVFDDTKPIFAIVGSSNMTRPAFDRPTPPARRKTFNNEADMVIWDSSNVVVDRYISASVRDGGDNFIADEMILDYDPAKNYGLTELDRLQNLTELLSTVEDIDLL